MNLFNVIRVSVGRSEYNDHTWLESEILAQFITIDKAIEYIQNMSDDLKYDWSKIVIEILEIE